MMLVQRKVGCLAEVLYRPPLQADEMAKFMAGVRSLVAAADEPLVFFTDWRKLDSFPAGIADTIVWIMRRDNPRIRANAVLVSPGNTRFYRQVHDMLADARNADRRVFDDPEALSQWLDPMLSPTERKRRDALLAEDV